MESYIAYHLRTELPLLWKGKSIGYFCVDSIYVPDPTIQMCVGVRPGNRDAKVVVVRPSTFEEAQRIISQYLAGADRANEKDIPWVAQTALTPEQVEAIGKNEDKQILRLRTHFNGDIEGLVKILTGHGLTARTRNPVVDYFITRFIDRKEPLVTQFS